MNRCELANSVKLSLDQYFKDLDGEPPHALYDMVLACIEKPLLESFTFSRLRPVFHAVAGPGPAASSTARSKRC